MTCSRSYISYKDIISHLDVNYGDILLVHSDIMKLLYTCRYNNEEFDADIFVDSMIDKIGNSGTLLFPTFNWEFCRSGKFDYKNTESRSGALSKAALRRGDFIRTKHPIYSYAVWGNDKKYLYNLNNKSAFGHDSPFAYLHSRHAKQLDIGPDETFWYTKGYTSLHYFEEKVGVDYRYLKEFTGTYIDKDKVEKTLVYVYFVRDLNFKDEEGNELNSQVKPTIIDELKERGFYTKYSINNVYFGLIDMNGLGTILENELKTKVGKFIHFVPV